MLNPNKKSRIQSGMSQQHFGAIQIAAVKLEANEVPTLY
jgi:hypothetical protein